MFWKNRFIKRVLNTLLKVIIFENTIFKTHF